LFSASVVHYVLPHFLFSFLPALSVRQLSSPTMQYDLVLDFISTVRHAFVNEPWVFDAFVVVLAEYRKQQLVPFSYPNATYSALFLSELISMIL
jgi:hypothetical protein